MNPPAVELRGIVKRFGDVLANAGIDLAVAAGEVHALLGENGAGKSTLVQILYGLTSRDEGQIVVGGRPVEIASPADAIAAGIGMVTQHFSLVGPMTVAENLALGNGAGVLDMPEAVAKVKEVAGRLGISIDPAARVDSLSVGERQRVEIIKALSRRCRVLILDEPTAVLTPAEIHLLLESIKQLSGEGLAVVFISHKLEEVMQISGRVTVLRHGSVAGTVETAKTNPRALAQMMVGRPTFGVSADEAAPGSKTPRLEVRDLTAAEGRVPLLRGVSFEVGGGEVVGLAGVSGNGQAALAEVLAGIRPPTGGSIRIDGRSVSARMPHQLMAAGVGRIPEDRHAALIGDLDVSVNLALERLDDYKRRATLDRRGLRRDAQSAIERYSIKARPGDRMRTLSGGNVQKVLLARVLDREPAVLVASQPTRGLDVGATEFVHMRILEARDRGAAILLISEDLSELLALADRIMVMFRGKLVGEVERAGADPDRLGLMMAGTP